MYEIGMEKYMNRKHLLKTLIGSFLAVALVAFFALTVAPVGARAATYSLTATNFCGAQPNNANCDGQAPEAQGCNADAITISSTPIMSGNQTVGQVSLLYSRTCRSAWA